MAIYKPLTKYLAEIGNDNFGEWIIDRESKGTLEDPIQMPSVSFSDMVDCFVKDVYDFESMHPEYELSHYHDILNENKIEWGMQSMQEADCSTLDGKCVMALLLGAVQAERFSSGALLSFFKSGSVAKWLLRLKELDS